MKKVIISLLIALPAFVTATVASATNTSVQQKGDQIEQRQSAFEKVETLAKQAEKTIDGANTDWSALEQQSISLSLHSKSLLDLFPEGSQSGSKASEDVWNKPEKFNRLLIQMNQGFEQLYQASVNQNAGAAEAGLEQAQATCRGCHRSYRARW